MNDKQARGVIVGLASVASVIGGFWLTASNPDSKLASKFSCREGNHAAVVKGDDQKSVVRLTQLSFPSGTIFRNAAGADASEQHKKQAADYCATGAVPKP